MIGKEFGRESSLKSCSFKFIKFSKKVYKKYVVCDIIKENTWSLHENK